jgi:hypothetical protein
MITIRRSVKDYEKMVMHDTILPHHIMVGPYCILSKVNTLNGYGQAPSFPHGWLKISHVSNTPTMIGWTNVARCT